MSQRYDEFGNIAVDPTTGLHRLGANGPSLATARATNPRTYRDDGDPTTNATCTPTNRANASTNTPSPRCGAAAPL